MKKSNIQSLSFMFLLIAGVVFSSFSGGADQKPQADKNVMYRGVKDTVIVMTETLAEDVIGYEDVIPLKLFILKDKIVKIEALPNKETPKYFHLIKVEHFPKFIGMNVKKSSPASVDAVSGATWTADAVTENIKRGVEYYLTHTLK